MVSLPLLFRVYIGSKFEGVTFSDVEINPDVDFHFILSYAADYTNDHAHHHTDGNFHIFWDADTLSSSAVKEIKDKHPNVKVFLSLGGDKAIFKPDNDMWVHHAVNSLAELIHDFHIDGIDIKYEHFECSNDTFADCIGKLIKELKHKKKISLASIAPYDDQSGHVKEKYEALWKKYSLDIDYVNFQFYKQEDIKEVTQFIDYYKTQQSIFGEDKVLAGVISHGTDESKGLTAAKGFFDACRELFEDDNLPGIFVWAADLSVADGWSCERKAQHVLAGNKY